MPRQPDLQSVEVPSDISKDLFNNSFLLTLLRMDNGDVIRNLSDDLDEALSRSCALSKKSKLTLTLTVKPLDFAESGTRKIAVLPDVKITLPKGEPSQTVLFNSNVQGHHQLLPFDPQQPDMFTKELTVVPMPVRDMQPDKPTLKKA